MIEFFIDKARDGYELIADGTPIGSFPTEDAAADMAVRFAQDAGAESYRIFY